MAKLQRRRKFSIIKILLILFFVLITLAGIGMAYLWFLGKSKLSLDSGDNSNYQPIDITNENMILNTLLVGLDKSQEEQRGRSDSMMIASLDVKHKKFKITSLMRDLWVPIPGYGHGKLNAAYSFGGINLLARVIKSNFGLTIDRYIIVDFKKFENLIDKLGGLDLELNEKEVNFINTYSSKGEKLVAPKKIYHLNGNQTLQFSRDRNDPTADFKRTERQRIVISAIINKLRHSNMMELMSFAKCAISSVKTNFNINEIISLMKKYKKISDYPIITNRIPINWESKSIDKQSVLVSNLSNCRRELIEFIYENDIFKK